MTTLASSVDDAKALLSVVPFIWAAVTGILLTAAWRWSSETDIFNVPRSWGAVFAALGSVVVGSIIVSVLAPLSYKVTFTNRGHLEGFLVLYMVVFVSAVALTCFSVFAVFKAVTHLREVLRAQ